MDKKLSDKELETMLTDIKLFRLLFPIFDSMSRLGKVTTLDTLLMYLEKEE